MQRCGGQGGTSTRFFIDQCCQGILQEIPLEMPLNMPEIDMARYEAENDQMCFLCFMSFCVFFVVKFAKVIRSNRCNLMFNRIKNTKTHYHMLCFSV